MLKTFKRQWLFLTGLYSLLLLYGSAIPNIILAVCGFLFIVSLFSKKLQLDFVTLKWLLIFCGYFFLYVFTLSYSVNKDYALKKIALQAILLATPIIFLSIRRVFTEKSILKIIQYNILSTCAFFIISIAINIVKTLLADELNLNIFFESSLSTSFVDIHFLELALLVSFNITSFLYILLFKKEFLISFISKYTFLIFLILGVFLFLLNSRTAIITTIIIVLITSLYYSIKVKRAKPIIFVFIALFFILFSNYTFNNRFRTKINEALKVNISESEKKYWGGRGMRELIWNCADHVISENIIFGVGIGDQQDELNLCYHKYRYGQLLLNKKRFNCHNIFLQSFLKSGIIGFLLFVGSILIPFIIALRKRNIIYIIFILCFVGNGMTESLLEVNFGVTFFSFFNVILFNLCLKNESFTNT